MTYSDEALRQAVAAVPTRPSLEELRRRTNKRRARRLALVAPVAVVTVALSIGIDARRTAETGVAANDPLRAALDDYRREVRITAAGDVAPDELPPDAVPGSVNTIGRIDGDHLITTYVPTGEQLWRGRRCVYVERRVDCAPPPHVREPRTSAVDGFVVWTNVPDDAVAVGLTAQDGSRWTRPYEGFAYFPVDGDSWHRFEITAFAADGSVLAAEEFGGPEGRGKMRWYTTDGRFMERILDKEDERTRDIQE